MAKVYDGPHATPKKTTDGPVYLGIDAISNDGHLIPESYAHLSEEDFPKWTKRVEPQEDDIVFSYEATLGRYAIIPHGFRGVLGRRLAVVRVDQTIVNPRWLYYYFLSPAWSTFIDNHTYHGSTVDRISVEDYPTYKVPLPDLASQDAAVSVLTAIDDKIANNKRLITELETTARFIFDFWFTQFDFPDECDKPYRSSGGKMVWSDDLKRSIPKEWTVGTLGDYLHLEKDTVTPTPGHAYEHYSIPAFDNGKFPTLDDGGNIESGKYRVQKGCILYSKLNPKFKRLWQPYCLTDDAICSTEFLVMQPDKPQYQGFCVSVLHSSAFYAHMVSKAISSTGSRSRVDPEVALSFAFARPTDKLIERYGTHVIPLFNQIQELEIENHELTSLRDWLLPMLMNGQATIGE